MDAAIASAVAAQAKWGGLAPQRRARVLFKMKELVERHTDDLARLITREHGKTFPDAQGEVQRGLEVIEFACGIPQLLKGQYSDSVGGGIALLASSIQATTSSGLVPELYNYHVDNLPALGLQARLGYTYGYKWLRVGIDGGYRFGGGTSIVVQLPDRESLPTPGPGGGPQTSTLRTPRQELATTAHDADAAVSFGGYLQLPKNLELAIRLRAGMQFFGFIPELNATTPLPQELFYGPLIGALVEFQSQFVQIGRAHV